MAGNNKQRLQPIIIKRVRKGAQAHNAGTWKIAYADFVTAMMAFFLLMWLMGSLSEGERKGIADYFSSPMKMSFTQGMGASAGDSSSIIKGGGQDLTRSVGEIKRGDVQGSRDQRPMQLLKNEQARAEMRRLENLKTKVQAKLADNPRLKSLSSQLRIDMVQDGLRIQIVDELNRPMFASGSAVVQPYMRELLREIAQSLAEMPNRLTLEGHTDAHAYSGGERGYSNWELSSDRANASRRELVAAGLPEDRVVRVLGLASSMLFDPNDALNPQNRRISIIVMNREAEERFFRSATDPAPSPDAAADSSAPGVAPISPAAPSNRPPTTP
ncbi:flagellar motor protein MotB [Azohydromonas caseinilytica]|uniref:Flagellar motor protein MotB n=1 Tax=Azohydromonas caseinilytica TaxID=2728836 RepID=A0A848FA77_9BURK|nr:flagellar motor protein MotB [Azohydromonas caseinilytica]NML14891.1 flagellar motor protein MotB [Azohydromonas caseinilytica]